MRNALTRIRDHGYLVHADARNQNRQKTQGHEEKEASWLIPAFRPSRIRSVPLHVDRPSFFGPGWTIDLWCARISLVVCAKGES